MKRLIVSVLMVMSSCTVFGRPDTDSLLTELNRAIADTKLYDAAKLKEIGNLKRSLKKANTLTSQYDVYLNLYEEYKIFNFDSAFTYAKKLEQIAFHLNDRPRITSAKIKLCFILISA